VGELLLQWVKWWSVYYRAQKGGDESRRMLTVQIITLVLVLDEASCSLEVGLDHLLDEAVEVYLALPSENAFSLGGVTMQQAEGGG
jgi:hypothetical protein